jgi:hypothetical protein
MGSLSERTAWSSAVLLWICVFALAAAVGNAEEHASRMAYGCCSGEQILDRAARVWDTLGGAPRDVTLVARPMVALDRLGRSHRIWDVESLHEGERSLAVMRWDADIGRLWDLMRQPSYCGPVADPHLPRDEAVRIGRGALVGLGVVDSGTGLGNATMAERDGVIWVVVWKVGGVPAGVWVDARDGNVRHAWRGIR